MDEENKEQESVQESPETVGTESEAVVESVVEGGDEEIAGTDDESTVDA